MIDLPSNWTKTSLVNACEILDYKRVPVNSTQRELRKRGKRSDQLFPYYGATGQVDVIDDYLFEGEHILLGEDGAPFLDPFKEKAYVVDGKFWVNNHAHILKAHGNNKYLSHYLNTIRYEDHVSGTTRHKLTKTALKSITVPLPSIREQNSIVERVEMLFNEIKLGVYSLYAAKEAVEFYRQSLLRSAFEGQLTAHWREENADTLEDSDTLLVRILKEREICYDRAIDDWKLAVARWQDDGEMGKKPTKPKRPRPISELALSNISKEPWPSLEMGDLLSVSSGLGLTSKQMRGGSFSVYGGNGIAGSHDKYFLHNPTLIIGRVGAKCGVTHITHPKSWVTDNALIVQPLIDSFNKRFFKRLLEAKDLNSLGSYTGQPVISGTKIYPVVLEIPCIAEQVEIVRILDSNLQVCDTMNENIDAALTHAEVLRQSILKRAFSGQLVDQDPADEPATVLLDQIRSKA